LNQLINIYAAKSDHYKTDLTVLVGFALWMFLILLSIALDQFPKFHKSDAIYYRRGYQRLIQEHQECDGNYDSVQPQVHSAVDEDGKHACPESFASFLSQLSFTWMNGLMTLGYHHPLCAEDLWDVRPEDDSKEIGAKFDRIWKQELEKAEAANQDGKEKKPSLVWSLILCDGGLFPFAGLIKIGQDVLQFTQPQFLKAVVRFIKYYTTGQDENETLLKPPVSYGFWLAAGMLFTALLQSMLLQQYFHRCIIAGMRLRSALVTAIYKKSLRLANSSRQKNTVGEIVNYMSVDAQRLMDLLSYMHILWSGPLQISRKFLF
jgi:hypothetical protein